MPKKRYHIPMRFEFETDEHSFTIEVLINQDFRPDGKFNLYPQSSIEQWREGNLAFYNVIITSRLLGDHASDSPEAQTLIHYSCGILLPTEKQELQEELEMVLDNDGLIEHVLNHWELHLGSPGPEWKNP